jgi:hypothetical protein
MPNAAKYQRTGEGLLRLFCVALLLAFLVPSSSFSQTQTPTQSSSVPEAAEGPTAFVQVQGTYTRLGIISSADINLGYNFNTRIGADVGLPIFYTRSPFSQVINHDWKTDTLMGEPYLDVHYNTTRYGARFTSVLTGTIPAASSVRIYSTGRVGVDWFNHIQPEKAIGGRITPFINFGLSNGTVNRYYMPRPYSTVRPYQTLGIMGDGEAGVTIQVIRGIKIGGSAYGLQPGGPQKVFSRLVTPGSSVVGALTHGRFWNNAFETVGNSGIDRDNGFSAWVEVNRLRNVSLMVGATHSVHYAYDSVNLVVNFDATDLLRSITGLSKQ